MFRFKRKILLLGAVLTALGLTAEIVSEDAHTLVYREAGGNQVTLRKCPQRTVIGFASLAQIWYAAGGAAVAVPDVKSKETLPEAARDLPIIGGATHPNPEKVVLMEPDLTLLMYRHEKHRALAEQLRAAGRDALCVQYNNYHDFERLLDLFCRLNGRTLAETLAAATVTREVEAICAAVAAAEGPRTAIVFVATGGLKLESANSNTGAMAALLGAKNIAADQSESRIGFSYERLLLEDPEVLLIIMMGEADALREKFRREITAHSAWHQLTAAQTGRVHFLPSDLFLYQAGTRYPEAFRHLAALLYPEGAE